MSLIDNLKEKAIDAISDKDKQREWVESGFDAALKEGKKLLPEGDEPELKAVRESGEFALAKLAKHKGALVQLGQHGLRSTLSVLALGDYSGAARHAALVTLRETASWDAVGATIVDAAEKGNQAKRDFDAAVKEITGMLGDIGVAAARAVLPLFLALI